jgi:hypothetical protein
VKKFWKLKLAMYPMINDILDTMGGLCVEDFKNNIIIAACKFDRVLFVDLRANCGELLKNGS